MSKAQNSLFPAPVALETAAACPTLAVATGKETPVRSPAHELQLALQEMLEPRAVAPRRPIAAAALAFGIATSITACGVFWMLVARLVVSWA